VLRFSHKDICPLARRTETCRSFEPAASQQHRVRDDNGSGSKAVRQIREPSTSSRHPRLLTCGKAIPRQPISLGHCLGLQHRERYRATLWVDGDYLIRESWCRSARV